MPWQRFRFGRISDGQIAELIEDVMQRWLTNDPMLAIGGFSRAYVDEGWDRKLRGRNTFAVSSATISEKGGLFTIHYRRGREGPDAADEVGIHFGERTGGRAGFAAEDQAALAALVQNLVLSAPRIP